MSTDRNPLSDRELWQRLTAPAAVLGSSRPGSSDPGSSRAGSSREAGASDARLSDVKLSDVSLSDLEFAAWLEGRLSDSEAARIEATVAADPVLLRGALDLADILGKPLPAPSPRLAVRAQALVGFEAERADGPAGAKGGGWLGRLFNSNAVFGVPRAAMATLALGIAVAGFLLGGGLGESYAEQKYVVASNQVTTNSAARNNELTAFFGSDGI
jgi:hypothetical protein